MVLKLFDEARWALALSPPRSGLGWEDSRNGFACASTLFGMSYVVAPLKMASGVVVGSSGVCCDQEARSPGCGESGIAPSAFYGMTYFLESPAQLNHRLFWMQCLIEQLTLGKCSLFRVSGLVVRLAWAAPDSCA